jgi:7,8-dihydroneopterin aldolase/epimerase/oxygenase
MDTVFIHGLEAQALIGVHAWEREALRPLRFDLELGVDIREAAASDRVRDAVDYAAVAERVHAVCAGQQPQLLETLAEHLARQLFQEFPIRRLRLTVHKPGAVAGTASVGVRIERLREDYAACGF